MFSRRILPLCLVLLIGAAGLLSLFVNGDRPGLAGWVLGLLAGLLHWGLWWRSARKGKVSGGALLGSLWRVTLVAMILVAAFRHQAVAEKWTVAALLLVEAGILLSVSPIFRQR